MSLMRLTIKLLLLRGSAGTLAPSTAKFCYDPQLTSQHTTASDMRLDMARPVANMPCMCSAALV